MRSGSTGGLVSQESSKVKLDRVKKKDSSIDAAKSFFPRNLRAEDIKTMRANEYATPTHSATATNAYSLSFPV